MDKQRSIAEAPAVPADQHARSIAITLLGEAADGAISALEFSRPPAKGKLYIDQELTTPLSPDTSYLVCDNALTTYFDPPVDFDGILQITYVAFFFDGRRAEETTATVDLSKSEVFGCDDYVEQRIFESGLSLMDPWGAAAFARLNPFWQRKKNDN